MSKTEIELENKRIVVTGAAGFIGAKLICDLLSSYKDTVFIGIDNMNGFYDVDLKHYRLKKIEEKSFNDNWEFCEGDISDMTFLRSVFEQYEPNVVINLAAQAGVRYSIENPEIYIMTNIVGFYNILECCRNDQKLEHLVFASSSSVYGGRTEVPFRETDQVDTPVSLYAATKKSDELLAHCYSKLYSIPATGLRLFTVYGPAGRPDMAYFGFANMLVKGDKISIFNYGNCERDFTYIDDIVTSIISVMKKAPEKNSGEDGLPLPPYDIYNIGNSHPENLMTFVRILSEELIGAGVLCDDFEIDEHIIIMPMQPGDVPVTYADTDKFEKDFGYKPSTDLRTGLRRFAEWYKEYYSGTIVH